ncbi:MAG: MarR family winged helix-turn-helix transcriptional regulator [Acidimicrobiales bacterium]
MSDTIWLHDHEQRAWRGFLRTYERLTATLGRDLLVESGLSMQDYAVLVALSESPEGKMRAFELGRELVWEKSRVSHHIGRMIDRGLVERSTCPTDKRGAFISISAKGFTAIAGAAPGHVAAVRRYFIDQLSEPDLDALIRIADKVGNALNGALPDDECCEESSESR